MRDAPAAWAVKRTKSTEDPLVRDLSAEVLGLSDSEWPRLASLTADLDDPGVMSDAWS